MGASRIVGAVPGSPSLTALHYGRGVISTENETVSVRSGSTSLRDRAFFEIAASRRNSQCRCLEHHRDIHPTFFPEGNWFRTRSELANRFIGDLAVKTPSASPSAALLSGGNQQKVSLARWLATKPKVLILDEPTQGVDVGAKSEIHRIIRRLTKEGLAVMMISSNLAEVLGMSDRIAVMHGGTIVREFPGRTRTLRISWLRRSVSEHQRAETELRMRPRRNEAKLVGRS